MKYLLSALAVAFLFTSCMKASKNEKKDEKMKNQIRMQAFYDQVMNAHNAAAVDSFCSADYMEHAPDPGFTPDRDGLKKDLASLFVAFPDFHVQSNFMMSDSNMVTAQFTATGTNTGSYMGMP